MERAQNPLIWAKCPATDWQQLLMSDGQPGFIEPRDPPACVLFASDKTDALGDDSLSDTQIPLSRPISRGPAALRNASPKTGTRSAAIHSFYQSPYTEKKILSIDRSSFLTNRSPPGLLRADRSPSARRNNMSPEMHRASPRPSLINVSSFESIVRQLDKAENVSKSVVRRIENLKKKSSAVIDVL